jgi:uncharacterized protein with von Willebrand factor type A (vWA) domain
MFTGFFLALRKAGVPVSLREYLTLIEAMDRGLADYAVEDFYYLSRAAWVKDERHLDRFDRVFSHVFKGLEADDAAASADAMPDLSGLPEDWLKAMTELYLDEDERARIDSLGGWDKLMETLRQRLAEQSGRHEGGSKWIGTGGTSPFGAYGYNPEGIRIGQHENRHNRAVKVWDKREFKNLDDSVEIGTRTIKVALRRLRRFAREGAADELDLDGTIRSTAQRGWLDVRMVPERHNAVKVLLFLDVGGSMNPHIRVMEELFSAARSEFKHLEYFYFHNCPYERLWRDNRRRFDEAVPTAEVIRTFGADYRLVVVGDASMSPYEIVYPGGSVEHWNDEPGEAWMGRLLAQFPKAAWLNPVPESHWRYTQSIGYLQQLMDGRMYPLTIAGLDAAMSDLAR